MYGDAAVVLPALLALPCHRLSFCPYLLAVLNVPFTTFWGSMPGDSEGANAGSMLPEPLAGIFIQMSSPVLKDCETFKVFRLVVEGVLIPVMDLMPLRNRAVMILPHLAMKEGEPTVDGALVVNSVVTVLGVWVAIEPGSVVEQLDWLGRACLFHTLTIPA